MRTFAVYNRVGESTSIQDADERGAVFDVEWKSGLTEFSDALLDAAKIYQPVATFRLKAEAGGRWLKEGEHKHWLLIRNTIYSAEDVLNGEADEHIEKRCNIRNE